MKARYGFLAGVLLAFPLLAPGSARAVLVTTSQGNEADLAATYSSTDLLQGLIPVELPGDKGWHPANPASGNTMDAQHGLPVFTDGVGPFTGLSGLLNDYPGDGAPAKRLQYTLPAASDIGEVRVFTGNDGRDGRVFHTYTVEFSPDGQTWSDPLYVQSHLSGTINNATANGWRNVLTQLADPAGASLATGVTGLRFNFYAVDNTQGQMRDPFSGDNPFTGVNDGFDVPVASPLIWEIDVLPGGGGVIPEPSSLLLLGSGLGGLLPFLRRKR